MHDFDDARELILAEWRSCHPAPTDNLGIDLPIFVEGILAEPALANFRCRGDRRQQVREWIMALENDRHREHQSQYESSATL